MSERKLSAIKAQVDLGVYESASRIGRAIDNLIASGDLATAEAKAFPAAHDEAERELRTFDDAARAAFGDPENEDEAAEQEHAAAEESEANEADQDEEEAERFDGLS